MMEWLTSENLSLVPGVRHGFFTRKGGVSSGLLSSANFSLRPPETQSNIQQNHKRLLQEFGGGFSKIHVLSQKHTNKVVMVDQAWEDAVKHDAQNLQADGLITLKKGILLGVLTADCLPLLLASRDGSVIAAIHAGWRGALDGVVENALKALLKLAPPEDYVAAIGPCLQQHNFEVGPEFVSAFHQRYMSSRGFFLRRENKTYFNLEGFVRFQLQSAKISNIKLLHLDTYSDPERFFSYRRATHKGETIFGCQISVIGITAK